MIVTFLVITTSFHGILSGNQKKTYTELCLGMIFVVNPLSFSFSIEPSEHCTNVILPLVWFCRRNHGL